jgi:uncharacterized protein with HEPN domain
MQPLEERDASYLWDMREAAREIVGFIQGVRFAEFEKNKALRYAVERLLLVIGEAANHVSPQFRRKHPETPWARIVGLRNILAHEYGEILTERVWLAATESVPELLKSLAGLLPD